jgi:uncharacterized SAM-binding protein YcdF (DUF218 family)
MNPPTAYTYSFGIGANGLKMLLISLLAIGLSLGLSLLWVLLQVWRQARYTPTRPQRDGAILVLGMKLVDCQPGKDFRLRLDRARALLAAGHPGPVYVLGGETSPGCGSEAACGQAYLLAHGVDPACIQLEAQSRHTLENLRFVREMLQGQHALIISNRFHLARSAALARGLGMSFETCAAEDEWPPGQWPRLLREAFFLHWYYSGALWARLVRDRGSLARIH